MAEFDLDVVGVRLRDSCLYDILKGPERPAAAGTLIGSRGELAARTALSAMCMHSRLHHERGCLSGSERVERRSKAGHGTMVLVGPVAHHADELVLLATSRRGGQIESHACHFLRTGGHGQGCASYQVPADPRR